MTWFLWMLIALHVLGTLVRIGMIGQPRKPFTAGDVIFLTAVDLAIIYGLLATISTLNGGV